MQEPTTTTSKFPASPAILIESEEPENRKLNLLHREKTGETGNRVLVHADCRKIAADYLCSASFSFRV